MLLKKMLGTVEGPIIDLQTINIDPCNSATIRYSVSSNTGPTTYEYIMEGEQYARWGNDDTIIFHLLCARHNLTYKPYQEPEFFEEVLVWRDETSGEIKSEIIRKPNPKYIPPNP
jgi:hypothetical protein